MIAALLAAGLAIAPCPPPPAPRVTCVVDGDTIWLRGEKMRLVDIDAPELNGRCPAERELAVRARDQLVELLRQRRRPIRREGEDRFGRTLVRIEGVGRAMIRAGVAQPWRGRKARWCR